MFVCTNLFGFSYPINQILIQATQTPKIVVDKSNIKLQRGLYDYNMSIFRASPPQNQIIREIELVVQKYWLN